MEYTKDKGNINKQDRKCKVMYNIRKVQYKDIKEVSITIRKNERAAYLKRSGHTINRKLITRARCNNIERWNWLLEKREEKKVRDFP